MSGLGSHKNLGGRLSEQLLAAFGERGPADVKFSGDRGDAELLMDVFFDLGKEPLDEALVGGLLPEVLGESGWLEMGEKVPEEGLQQTVLDLGGEGLLFLLLSLDLS